MKKALGTYAKSFVIKSAAIGTIGIGANIYYARPNQKLYEAIKEEDIDKIKAALESGADVNNQFMPFGTSPLHYAGMTGNPNTTQYLINAGANVNQQDTAWKNTPLKSTILAKSMNTFSIKIEKESATLDEPKGHLLTKIVQEIIGPSKPPLVGDHDAVIRLLITNNADSNIKDNTGASAFHALVATHDNQELIKLFMRYGADLESQDKDLCTPLHYAAGFGSSQTCKTLIEAGAQVAPEDIDGHTPVEHLLKSIKLDNEAQKMETPSPQIMGDTFYMYMEKTIALMKEQNKSKLEQSKPSTSMISFGKVLFDFFSQGKNIIATFSKWAMEDIAKEKSDAISLFPESPTQINQYLAQQEEMFKPAGQDPDKPTDTDL